MNKALTSLTEALTRRLALVADRGWYERDAGSHLEALVEVSHQIDQLSGEVLMDEGSPERLKHYLIKKSYNKALLFIKTGDVSD